VTGTAAAGFLDASLWEESKKKGDRAIKALIDEALLFTTVTVVFVTYGTSTRDYINYEIDESLKRGNGLVVVQIHHLKDPNSPSDAVGATPQQINANGYKLYKYSNMDALARWIEEAAKIAGK